MIPVLATISLIVCPGVAEVAGVVELLGVDDGGATQAAAFGGGHRPGVRSAFQGVGALHLCEQGE